MDTTLTRLDERVVRGDVSPVRTAHSWHALRWRLPQGEGVGLYPPEEADAGEVALDLGVTGWHKVWLCMLAYRPGARLQVSLSGREGMVSIGPSPQEPARIVEGCRPPWMPDERAEEMLYTCADLTGAQLVLHQLKDAPAPSCVALLYVRLESMTPQQVAQWNAPGSGRICYHFDTDYLSECDYRTPADYTGRLRQLSGGNGGLFIHEDGFLMGMPAGVQPLKENLQRFGLYLQNEQAVRAAVLAQARAMGLVPYAGFRMGMGDFHASRHSDYSSIDAAARFTDCLMVGRSGQVTTIPSYAYEAVRRCRAQHIARYSAGYDGVSLFFHRGSVLGFEPPVEQAVRRRWGVSARSLPLTDARLQAVYSDLLTEFLRTLREELDAASAREGSAPRRINVVAFYDEAASKTAGIDVRRWAQEGLIDSFCQGMMTHYETLGDCLTAQGTVDVARYTQQLEQREVLYRWWGDDFDHILGGVPGFLEIQRQTGVRFYATMAWDNHPSGYYLDLARRLYALGVEHILCWNANQFAKNPTKLEAVKYASCKERLAAPDAPVLCRLPRVLMLDGVPRAEFNPNWKG